MPTFERSIEVPAPRDALFWWMQDYARRLEWDTFLIEARLVGDAPCAAVGIRAWCVDRKGRGMETEYVSFKPPERVAVRMTRGPWMFRSFAGSWAYEAVDEGRTRVTFRYQRGSAPAPRTDHGLDPRAGVRARDDGPPGGIAGRGAAGRRSGWDSHMTQSFLARALLIVAVALVGCDGYCNVSCGQCAPPLELRVRRTSGETPTNVRIDGAVLVCGEPFEGTVRCVADQLALSTHVLTVRADDEVPLAVSVTLVSDGVGCCRCGYAPILRDVVLGAVNDGGV